MYCIGSTIEYTHTTNVEKSNIPCIFICIHIFSISYHAALTHTCIRILRICRGKKYRQQHDDDDVSLSIEQPMGALLLLLLLLLLFLQSTPISLILPSKVPICVESIIVVAMALWYLLSLPSWQISFESHTFDSHKSASQQETNTA